MLRCGLSGLVQRTSVTVNSSSFLFSARRCISGATLTAWGQYVERSVETSLREREGRGHAALEVRDQLQSLMMRRGDPNAKVHLSGSMVAMGCDTDETPLVELCCPGNGMNAVEGGGEGAMADTLLAAVKRSVPLSLEPALTSKMTASKHRVVALRPAAIATATTAPAGSTTPFTVIHRIRNRVFQQAEVEQIASRHGEDVAGDGWSVVADGSGGSVLTLRPMSPLAALEALTLLPDGKVMPHSQRGMVVKELGDAPPDGPAVLRHPWEASFCGHTLMSSYLFRSYLLAESSPPHVLQGMLFLDKWRRRALMPIERDGGLLSREMMTILWLYFLLCSRKAEWIDPKLVPHGCDLPLYPSATHDSSAKADPRIVGELLFEFLRFYTEGFDYEHEVASVCRPRRSSRRDLDWEGVGTRSSYAFCCEDPFDQAGGDGSNLGEKISALRLRELRGKFRDAMEQMLQPPPASLSADADPFEAAQ